MADTATNTKSYTWLWWVLGITGIAAVGTTVWYFFFRKDSKYAQDQAKKREQNDQNGSSSQGNGSQGSNSQGSSNSTSIENVEQPPHIIMPTANDTPPKTEKPKDTPKEEKPKVLGDVFNDIYAPNAKRKIAYANKNGKALVQALLNNFNDAGMIKVDGIWGPKSEDAYQRAKNKLNKKTGIKYPEGTTQQIDQLVYDMANWQNIFLKADMDDIKAYVRKVPASTVFLS